MAVIKITDFNAPELDVYARLSEVQLLHYNEPEDGIFITESPKVIERALAAGYEPISFLVEDKKLYGETEAIIKRYAFVPIFTAPFEVLTQLTGFKLTRGMLCAMRRRVLPSVSEVCAGARRVAVLENVMNPTNVGAIFRSAAALNMDAVLLTHGCSNPLYRRAARVRARSFRYRGLFWTRRRRAVSPSLSHLALKRRRWRLKQIRSVLTIPG